jgi:hypothetical protein
MTEEGAESNFRPLFLLPANGFAADGRGRGLSQSALITLLEEIQNGQDRPRPASAAGRSKNEYAPIAPTQGVSNGGGFPTAPLHGL